MTVLKMPVLENDSTGKCRYWKMTVLENDSTGKCQYRSVANAKIFIVQIVVAGSRLI